MTVKAAIKEEIKNYNKVARGYFSRLSTMERKEEISDWGELRGRRETLISLVNSLSATLGFESKRTRYTKLILLRIVKTEEEEK